MNGNVRNKGIDALLSVATHAAISLCAKYGKYAMDGRGNEAERHENGDVRNWASS